MRPALAHVSTSYAERLAFVTVARGGCSSIVSLSDHGKASLSLASEAVVT